MVRQCFSSKGLVEYGKMGHRTKTLLPSAENGLVGVNERVVASADTVRAGAFRANGRAGWADAHGHRIAYLKVLGL